MSEMLEGFVQACLGLIESRDPTTAGHSERVAVLTVGLAEQADAVTQGPLREVRFSREQLRALRYASLLHDIGVIGVREKVLVKQTKLHPGELKLIEARFKYVKRTLEVEHLRSQLELVRSGADDEGLAEMDRAHEQAQQELDRLVELVSSANQPAALSEDTLGTLVGLPRRSYPDLDGTRRPLLSPAEVATLSIGRGSLTERERREMESHVTHSFRFLSRVPWTEGYRDIPEIAYAHHEKLDGSG
jgi:response regulator RpfG family c-di-GMP phosphodiesterase